MLSYPNIDPVCLSFFGIDIYWYSIAYIVSIITGLWLCKFYQRNYFLALPHDTFDRLMSYLIIGIVVGGRVGHVLFYAWEEFVADPLFMVELPIRGMSFHGGFVGVAMALWLFAYRSKIRFFVLADVIASCTPIGLLLGRLANFINGELYGRITNSWFGMVFPGAGVFPRHPSQLYEAFSEGLILFLILNSLYAIQKVREKPGIITGLFIALYGVFRFLVEYLREPSDGYAIVGNLWLTLGQVYSIPMIGAGMMLILLIHGVELRRR